MTLAVNGQGEALLTYSAAGKLKHVLAWGAVNAIAPTRARPQVALKLDYSGGYGKYRRDYWTTFGAACGRYDGPSLGWNVTACRAPDGSYWALQAWQRALPNYGVAPAAAQSAWALAVALDRRTGCADDQTDWSYRRFDHLYGSITYLGQGVYGFRSTHAGVPLDTFGRNLYVDTFNSRYGSGWKRENSSSPTGSVARSVTASTRTARTRRGRGRNIRATVIGPGVTPDVLWEGAAPGSYDRAADQTANQDQPDQLPRRSLQGQLRPRRGLRSVSHLPPRKEFALMPLVAIVIIVLVFALPLAYLGWRFSHGGGDLESGGSMGNQMSGGKDEDWGPHSD